MSFENVITSLKNEKEQAVLKHDKFIKDIDILIEQAESISGSMGPPKNGKVPTPINLVKINFEDVCAVLIKANRTLHLDQICEIMSGARGEKVSRLSVSMLISHHFKKFKRRAQIKQLDKHIYCAK